MEYIKKQNFPPPDWDKWFTTATDHRSFDYMKDQGSLTKLSEAKLFLLEEQNFLCAYCQQKLTADMASIEHVIPKEHNLELSTNYFNLVAVCKSSPKDPLTDRLHCDKEKQSNIIASILFVGNNSVMSGRNNAWFEAFSDGSIKSKYNTIAEHAMLADAFIETVNLNHYILKQSRAKDALDSYLSIYYNLDPNKRKFFWHNQFNRILLDLKKPFRQFLLIYIGKKIGIS